MAVPSHVGSNTQDSAAAQSLTFTVPAATTTDDFILVFVKQSENTGAQVWDDDGGGGNGYTRLEYNRTTSGRDQETAVYYKFATSGSEANPTFTWNSGGTNEPMSGIMEVYRNVDTVQPFQGPSVALGTNDAAPPNPSVTISFANTRVVCNHAATHDDISTVAAPTGFTLRSQVWNGTADDHRNNFTADIEIDTLGSYSPPDWQHSVLNTTPEYATYTIALNEAQPIHITGGTAIESFSWGATGLTVIGDGFEATQGTGKVEYWDDVSGTTKTVQTISSWSDTSITIDTAQGSLPNDTFIYLVVTNDSADESGTVQVPVGLLPYESVVANLGIDHYWVLDNTYDDTGETGPVRNMTSGVVGTWTFSTDEIRDGNTHSLNMDGVTKRREIADSENMNVTITSAERTVCCWFQTNINQHPLAAIWKEGGGVQNLALLVGYGGVVLWQLADVASTRDNVQAWSDERITPGVPYFLVGRYSNSEDPAEARLYINAELQTNTDGNPMTINIFDSHSGDVTWNDPDNNLETGATDISYNGIEDGQLSDFMTFSDNSTGTNAGGLSQEDIDELFERGAIPDDTISTGTESAMQTSVGLLDENRPEWPLSLRVEGVTGGGDFELRLEDATGNPWVFNDRVSRHVEYRGANELTVINPVGGNFDLTKSFSRTGGTIAQINEVLAKITCRDAANTATTISGARVIATAAEGGGGGGVETITFVDGNNNVDTTYPVDVTVPTHVADDVAINFLGYAEFGITFDVNDGFTQPADVDHGSTGGTDRFGAWQYQVMDGSEPTNYGMNFTGLPSGSRLGSVVGTFRGVDTTTPLAVTPTTSHRQEGQNEGNPTNQTIDTTGIDGCMIILLCLHTGGARADYTAPTGTTIVDQFTLGTLNMVMAYELQTTGGVYTPAAWGGEAGGVLDYYTATIALRPASSGGGGAGNLPYQDTVTITRSGSTATVTHTAHGLAGKAIDKMLIEDAVQTEYNGVKEITITGDNTYTFIVSGTPTTPATGTIQATAVLIDGETDSNGEISLNYRYFGDQAIEGKGNQGSKSTTYKSGGLSATILSTGIDADIFMVTDE